LLNSGGNSWEGTPIFIKALIIIIIIIIIIIQGAHITKVFFSGALEIIRK